MRHWTPFGIFFGLVLAVILLPTVITAGFILLFAAFHFPIATFLVGTILGGVVIRGVVHWLNHGETRRASKSALPED
jgi:uncharacterized integral membrane protein